MSLRSAWLSLFVTLLSACSGAPRGPIGIIGDAGCIYHDPSKPEPEQNYVLSFQECKNHIATHPEHHRRVERAFVDCTKIPDGPQCIVGDAGCICHDGTLSAGSQDYVLSFPACVNHVVTTAEYSRRLLSYYHRRCEQRPETF